MHSRSNDLASHVNVYWLRVLGRHRLRVQPLERPGATHICEVAAAGTTRPPTAHRPRPGRPSLGKDTA
eukprot:12164355-Alexandrium_andersonii.AAC.1